MGTHVHLWLIHVNVWQNQYSIVKKNKVKITIKKRRKIPRCWKRLKAVGEGDIRRRDGDAWHHQLNGPKFEQALGDGVRQASLVCYSLWGCRVRHD